MKKLFYIFLILCNSSIGDNLFSDSFGYPVNWIEILGVPNRTNAPLAGNHNKVWYAPSNSWESTGTDIKLRTVNTNYFALCQYADVSRALYASEDMSLNINYPRINGRIITTIRRGTSQSSNNLVVNTNPVFGTVVVAWTNTSSTAISTNFRIWTSSSVSTAWANNALLLLTIYGNGTVDIAGVQLWYTPTEDSKWQSENLLYEANLRDLK